MQILFVDNKPEEYESFLELPFAAANKDKIAYRQSPVGLSKVVQDNQDLRLIVLDMLWESDDVQKALALGADAMRDLAVNCPEVPVIIYSILDDEEILRELIPEMTRLGAYDWISKDEPRLVRSFKIEQAYKDGRNKLEFPLSRAVLPKSQDRRSDVHVAVMFCDLSGFTALSDRLSSDDLLSLLSDFYALAGEAIRANQGYVDKYIGDEVMAVFGAIGSPSDDDLKYYRHVNQAIDTARNIQAASNLFRLHRVEPLARRIDHHWGPDKLSTIGKLRIGIESGPVEIHRFLRGNESEVTFIGTSVNIAARIIAKASPGESWVGQNVVNATGLGLTDLSEETEYKNLPGTFWRYRLRG